MIGTNLVKKAMRSVKLKVKRFYCLKTHEPLAWLVTNYDDRVTPQLVGCLFCLHSVATFQIKILKAQRKTRPDKHVIYFDIIMTPRVIRSAKTPDSAKVGSTRLPQLLYIQQSPPFSSFFFSWLNPLLNIGNIISFPNRLRKKLQEHQIWGNLFRCFLAIRRCHTQKMQSSPILVNFTISLDWKENRRNLQMRYFL